MLAVAAGLFSGTPDGLHVSDLPKGVVSPSRAVWRRSRPATSPTAPRSEGRPSPTRGARAPGPRAAPAPPSPGYFFTVSREIPNSRATPRCERPSANTLVTDDVYLIHLEHPGGSLSERRMDHFRAARPPERGASCGARRGRSRGGDCTDLSVLPNGEAARAVFPEPGRGGAAHFSLSRRRLRTLHGASRGSQNSPGVS
jgi:hypothetical protein